MTAAASRLPGAGPLARFAGSRALWFLAERGLAQLGGLALVALLARRFPAEEAAGFLAAYALASVFQPLLANACQPPAMRLWRQAGAAGFLSLWLGVQAVAAVVAALFWAIGGPLSAMAALALAAPWSMMAAPLIAEDRWRAVLSVLIPVGALGVALRLFALWQGRSDLAALGFAVEPLIGGGMLAFRAGVFGGKFGGARGAMARRAGRRAFFAAAPPLMLAMAATTFFWRAPVLLAEMSLGPADVLRIAFALQLIAGFMMFPNAVIQSRLGLIAAGGEARRRALAAGLFAGLGAGAGALLIALAFGEALLGAIYGEAAAGAGALLIGFAPLIALGALWRLVEFTAAHDGAQKALLATRLVAAAGVGATALALQMSPTSSVLAVGVAATLSLSAVALPALSPRLRPVLGACFAGLFGRAPRPAEAPAPPEPQGSRG